MNIPSPTADNSYQFGMRSILGLMVAAALLAAAAAPYARSLDRAQLIGICVYLATVLVIAAMIVVVNGWKRRRVERDAGPVHFVFYQAGWKKLLPILFLILAFLYALVGVVCVYARGYIATAPLPTGQKAPPQLPAYFLAVQAWGGGFFLGVGLGFLLARTNRVQLRENGLIAGWHFVPWNKMSRMSWSWKNGKLHWWGVGRPHFELPSDPARQDEVDRFLREHIVTTANANALAANPATSTAPATASALPPIAIDTAKACES